MCIYFRYKYLHYLIYDSKCFLPFCGLSFHFMDDVLWSTKIFNFNQVNLSIFFLLSLVLLVSYHLSLSERKLCIFRERKLMSYMLALGHMDLLGIAANNLIFILSTDGHLPNTLCVFQVTSALWPQFRIFISFWKRMLVFNPKG